MARAGRKRKAGKREKNGRIQRYNKGESANAMAARETVALQRCRLMGWGEQGQDGHWIATAKQQQDAMDPMLGTVEGRLRKAGRLTVEQYDAARAWADADARYRSVMGLPPATVSAVRPDGSGGGMARDPFDVDDEAVARVRSRHADFVRALRDAGGLVAAMHVVLHQQEPGDADMLAALQRGMDGLHRAVVDTRR